jgi:hypothetical protein
MGNLIARHFGELSATKIRYKLKGASLGQRENKALLFVASSFEFTLGGIVAFESCILSVTMGLLRAPLGTATGRILWRRVKIMHFLEWRELEKRKRPLYILRCQKRSPIIVSGFELHR